MFGNTAVSSVFNINCDPKTNTALKCTFPWCLSLPCFAKCFHALGSRHGGRAPSWSPQVLGQSLLLQGPWLSPVLTFRLLLSLCRLREGRKMGMCLRWECAWAFPVCQGWTSPGTEPSPADLCTCGPGTLQEGVLPMAPPPLGSGLWPHGGHPLGESTTRAPQVEDGNLSDCTVSTLRTMALSPG